MVVAKGQQVTRDSRPDDLFVFCPRLRVGRRYYYYNIKAPVPYVWLSIITIRVRIVLGFFVPPLHISRTAAGAVPKRFFLAGGVYLGKR